jgi:adenylyltransferase/sulfurtransferase
MMRDELHRYHRQMLLPNIGEAGQRRLRESTALLLGCGALGSVAADMLARAGVGHLVIVDRDFVELTNLQRQVLFDERDVEEGIPKAAAAKRKLATINSNVDVTAIVDDINHGNIDTFAAGADVIVDGLDNFETRYLANDLAVRDAIPYVYGAAVGTTGMAFTVLPRAAKPASWKTDQADYSTPCFRCLFEEAPPPGTTPTCDTAGVLGPAIGIVANHQVAEALKILTGNFGACSRMLLNVDLWFNEIMQLEISSDQANTDCPCCGQRRFDYLEGKEGSSAAVLCGRDAVQLRHRQGKEDIDFDALAARLRPHGSVSTNAYVLRAVLDQEDDHYEITLFRDGRAIIKGTDDAGAARGIYAKYIGA